MLLPFSAPRSLTVPLLALTLLAGGCKTLTDIIRPSLPEATQEGKDTFGCLLNDEVWLPNTKHTLDDILEADVTSDGKYFTLKAEDNHGPSNFHLSVGDAAAKIKPGTYALGKGFSASYDSYKSGSFEQFFADAATGNQGSLTITKFEPYTKTSTVPGIPATVKGAIVSGTFAFTATDAAGRTITVREGRFDVQASE